MGKLSIKGQLAKELLDRFPKAPILTLAKKLYKENSETFKDVEEARTVLRYRIGQVKNGSGYMVSDKSQLREKTFKYNPFDLPESHADPFEPFEIKQTKTLIISDLHFPYQDNQAITLALNYGLEKKVDCILINGDLIDFAPISRHEKDWRHRTVGQEFEAVRAFLKGLRKNFPKARIIFKQGNHDERWEKWLYVKAPELFDDPEFKLEVRLQLGELKIEMVKDKKPVKIGKLTVLHGHELPGMGGVNPARATFMKTLESCLVGHYHRPSEHPEPTMSGHMIIVKSQGCLCGLHPQFAVINKWGHGFAYCEQNIKTGDYMLENLKIINGKIYK